MSRRTFENVMFVMGILAVVAGAFLMEAGPGWSETMLKRSSLGFHHGLTTPLLAVELAGTEEEFQQVIGADTASEADVKKIVRSLQWDFLFLTGYSLAFAAVALRLASLKATTSSAWLVWLLGTIGLLAALDIAENTLCLGSLASTPPDFNRTVAVASLAKWVASFLVASALGGTILKTRRTGHPAPLNGTWCLTGLLLLIGGVTGLLGCVMNPVLISPGFLFMAAANVPVVVAWLQQAPKHQATGT
jgi:hypothetical protein